jgi:haloalkane dehalogenase
MESLRTPDDRFVDLADFDFEPHYAEVDDTDGGTLRMHYVDEGADDAPVILLMHGEPSWSYLYRTMIPVLVDAGLRCVAPDLVGFGRSDKPSRREDYTYARHVEWVRSLIVDRLDLDHLAFFGQDWGGLIGLRLVAENPDRFDRVAIGNTGLPSGDQPATEAFMMWRDFSQRADPFDIGWIVSGAVITPMTDATKAAYDAPFPDDSFKQGARQFPVLVPISPDDPAATANRAARSVFEAWDKPFLTLFSDGDPVTKGGERWFQHHVPGASGQPHATIEAAGHFLQEDKGPEIAERLADWIRSRQ